MVEAFRSGMSLRAVAIEFGVSVSTVNYWVERVGGRRLDRVSFANRRPGRAWNRTPAPMEERILSVRSVLRQRSVLGEYGPDAIGQSLQGDVSLEQVPSRTTIYRVLERAGCWMGCIGNAGQRRPRGGICPMWPAHGPSSTALTSSRI